MSDPSMGKSMRKAGANLVCAVRQTLPQKAQFLGPHQRAPYQPQVDVISTHVHTCRQERWHANSFDRVRVRALKYFLPSQYLQNNPRLKKCKSKEHQYLHAQTHPPLDTSMSASPSSATRPQLTPRFPRKPLHTGFKLPDHSPTLQLL